MIDTDAFLRQEVETASPAKLRWLLIRKAIGLCQAVDQLWQDERCSEARQWLLRVREILCELLDGVTDSTNPAARQVADLYTFLLRSLLEAELKRNAVELQRIIEILQIELGTWALYVQREGRLPGDQLLGPGFLAPAELPAGCAAAEWAGLNIEA